MTSGTSTEHQLAVLKCNGRFCKDASAVLVVSLPVEA